MLVHQRVVDDENAGAYRNKSQESCIYKFTVIALPQKTQRTFLKEMRSVFLNISGNMKMDKLFNMANMEMYHQSTFTKHFRKHYKLP